MKYMVCRSARAHGEYAARPSGTLAGGIVERRT